MGYKYKVKEIEIGDVTTSSGVQTTVSDINPETGTVSWDVKKVPNFDTAFTTFKKLRTQLTDLSSKTEDATIDDMAMDIMSKFNEYRTHIRKNYPDIYRKTFAVNEAAFTNKFNIQSQDIGKLQKQAEFNSETSQPFNLVTNIDAGVKFTDKDMVSKYFNDDVAILQFYPMEDSENDTMYDAVDEKGVNIIRGLMKQQFGLDLVNPMILKGKRHCSADGEVCSVSHYLVFGKTVDEMSTSGAAGAYLTPYAFRLPKKKKKKKANEGTCGYDRDTNTGKKLTTPGGLKEDKSDAKRWFVNLMYYYNKGLTSPDLKDPADKEEYKKLTKSFFSTLKESKSEDPGATLGPGPAAGEDGVENNAYVKQFKYQLVPKDKKGNYVQKGSGLEVKNLF